MDPSVRRPTTACVAVADAQPVMRHGVRDVLQTQTGCRITGECASLPEVLRAVGQHPHPDLLVLDPEGLHPSLVELLQAIQEAAPGMPILVFTARRGDLSVREAFQSGVEGYLVKSAPGEMLLQAATALLDGRHFVDPEVASILLGALPHSPDRRASSRCLTARERAILSLLAEGLSNRDIAERLCISEATVKFHLHGLFRKLPARNRTEAVRQAVNLGLLVL